ncbi:MAG: SRPBCC domain-containing protein [Candidatus Symbiobacter sp.]|nr:SRPBCC domain-containing protein [Candidatus Symbiobacter sp.]
MEIKFDKLYPLNVDRARAWQVMRDVRAVASCMPGAEITQEISPTSYQGTVKAKVGPALAQFAGIVDVIGLDDANFTVSYRGKGSDKGGSSAAMELKAVLMVAADNPAHSVLKGEATVTVNGKFAQFGARIMVPVAEMIVGQFVDNFAAAAAALPDVSAGKTAPNQAATDPDQAASAAKEPNKPNKPKELNGLSLVWQLIKHWIAGLFGTRR